MEKVPVKWPLYARFTTIVVGIVALLFILHVGKAIIVPVLFATIIAILLNPVVNFLVSKNINKVIAILIAINIAIVIFWLVSYFIISQASLLGDSAPQFLAKITDISQSCIQWISVNFNISQAKINNLLTRIKSEGMNNSAEMIGSVLAVVKDVMVIVFLLPVYVFMVLFYKPLLLEFVSKITKKESQAVTADILVESKYLIQNYLMGLLIEAAIIAFLNSAGLLLLGIQYAILIGIIGALLNMIPYIGGIIAISLPMLIAIATKRPIDAVWVFILYTVIQFIDNYYIVPKIVASKVKVNAMVSLIVVLTGGALWGIAGMFLALPLTAIGKVIFDRVEILKPLGFLIGDNQPSISRSFLHLHLRKRSKRKMTKDENGSLVTDR